MTLQNVSDLLAQAIMSGAGAWVLVAIGKKIPWVPLSNGQNVRLRAIAAILSSISTILIGIAGNTLTVLDWQTFMVTASASLISFLTSQTVHVTVKKMDL